MVRSSVLVTVEPHFLLSFLLKLYDYFYYYPKAHATTVFQDKFWVVGGKSQYHPIYTLAAQNTENDVWYTEDGGTIWKEQFS